MWRIIKYELMCTKIFGPYLVVIAAITIMDYMKFWSFLGSSGNSNMVMIAFLIMFSWLRNANKENRFQGYALLPISLFKIASARTFFLVVGFAILFLFEIAGNFFIKHIQGITSQQLISIGLYSTMILGWAIVTDMTSRAKFEKQLLNKIMAYILSIGCLILIEIGFIWALIFIGKENFVFSSAITALQVVLLMFISVWAFMRRKEFVK